MVCWYAFQVSPRLWATIGASLQQRGLEVFIPVYARPKRWADRIAYRETPLFEGYVFCRFDVKDRYLALTVPGVRSIIGYGKYPQPIPDEEIANIRCAVNSGLARPCKYLQAGQRVRIVDGPMRGITGILVRSSGTERVVVSVSAVRSSIAVDVRSDWLIPESTIPAVPAASGLRG